MQYGRYKNVRNASWQCLIDFNVQELPVKVMTIANQAGISVHKYSNVSEDRLSTGESGVTFIKNNKIHIVYRDAETDERCRFTIAHELGHIFLGHSLTGNDIYRTFDVSKPEIEQEADVFASRLLAPACVLWGLNLHTAEEIARFCKISLSAAQVRADRMEILYKRNMFLSHPLERKVFNNFRDFIEKQNPK